VGESTCGESPVEGSLVKDVPEDEPLVEDEPLADESLADDPLVDEASPITLSLMGPFPFN